jgi:hypothetical protein
MRGFIDLHCHWIPGIDDGARTVDEGVAMLERLHAAGFDTVVATPHTRPGMFENDATGLRAAFAAARPERAEPAVPRRGPVPEVATSRASTSSTRSWSTTRLRARAAPSPTRRCRASRPYKRVRPILIELSPRAPSPRRCRRASSTLRRAGLAAVAGAPPSADQPGVGRRSPASIALIDAGAAAAAGRVRPGRESTARGLPARSRRSYSSRSAPTRPRAPTRTGPRTPR